MQLLQVEWIKDKSYLQARVLSAVILRARILYAVYSLTPDLALQSVGDQLSAVSATIKKHIAPLSKSGYIV